MSNYKELKIWNKAMELTLEVYRLVKFLPREETYALSDQLRRAVVSVASNIAEGHGRESDKEFVKFLLIAKGSLYEVDTQLTICEKLSMIPINELKTANVLTDELSKMISSLIRYRQTLTPKTSHLPPNT